MIWLINISVANSTDRNEGLVFAAAVLALPSAMKELPSYIADQWYLAAFGHQNIVASTPD